MVGTFAIYYGQPRLPEPGHLEVIEEISHLAAICILKTRTLTQMRRSEERFRSLIENGSDLITVVNNAGLIRYESPSAQRLMGYEPDEMIGRPALEFIHPDDAALVQAALQRALTMPNAPAPVEYRLRHRDGTWRTFESVGRSAPGEAAEGFVIVNSRDVTEPRALEAQLRQAQKMEAMGTLAGGIAHDFNNILTAILGNVELARWDLQKPTEVELGLSEITKAATRAKDLVRQILTFSRQQVQQRSVIPLGPVIEECASMLRATMPHSVEFKLALQTEVPLVRADATQIHQVMLNLCTNAWHALPASRGCIEVKLEAVELAASVRRRLAALPDGPCVALSVCDNGIGMTAATLERIYEPFFTTKEPGKGTGLGLSVVHGIVLAHEGVIEVESAPGQGTSFRIYFPAAIEDQARSMAAPPSPAAGGRLRIFYVDDEEALVRVGSRMLERLGFEVHGYVRPDEALASFRAAPDQVDAVVTDFNMPAICGLTLATEMLAIRPGLCVILSSGYVSEELHQRAQTVGIRRVIHKPNTLEQLAQALRAVMAEQ